MAYVSRVFLSSQSNHSNVGNQPLMYIGKSNVTWILVDMLKSEI